MSWKGKPGFYTTRLGITWIGEDGGYEVFSRRRWEAVMRGRHSPRMPLVAALHPTKLPPGHWTLREVEYHLTEPEPVYSGVESPVPRAYSTKAILICESTLVCSGWLWWPPELKMFDERRLVILGLKDFVIITEPMPKTEVDRLKAVEALYDPPLCDDPPAWALATDEQRAAAEAKTRLLVIDITSLHPE